MSVSSHFTIQVAARRYWNFSGPPIPSPSEDSTTATAHLKDFQVDAWILTPNPVIVPKDDKKER